MGIWKKRFVRNYGKTEYLKYSIPDVSSLWEACRVVLTKPATSASSAKRRKQTNQNMKYKIQTVSSVITLTSLNVKRTFIRHTQISSCTTNNTRQKYNSQIHNAECTSITTKNETHIKSTAFLQSIQSQCAQLRFIGNWRARLLLDIPQTTRLPSNLRSTTHECVHLVTRGHFRSRDRWRSHHSIRHNRKSHATRKLLSAWNAKIL